MEDLSQNIIKTAAYFDLFDMPLNSQQVRAHLYNPGRLRPSLSEAQNQLHKLARDGILKNENGYYFLSDRDSSIIQKRRESIGRSLKLLQKARPWLSCLAAWPGVEMIAICNNLAWLQAGKESDIDLFIVTKTGEIWQTRFALSSFLQIFKKRPQPGNEYGKLCVSFLVSNEAIDLKRISIENDVYMSYWLHSLMPVYDPSGMVKRIKEVNHSLSEIIGVEKGKQSNGINIQEGLFTLGRAFCRPLRLFPGLEDKTRAWQMKKFPPAIRSAANDESSNVVISDDMLKFHTNDRRVYYRDQWIKRYNRFL